MAKTVGTYHGISIGVSPSGTIARICSRCSGSGIWGQTIAFGFSARTYVCFKCNGSGLVGKSYLDMPTAIADCAKLEKSRDKARATRKAKSEARLDAWREENKEMLAEEAKVRAERKAQLEVQAAKSVYLSGAVGERVVFDGVITKALTFDTNYGYNVGTTRMIVLETKDNCAVKMTTTAEWAYDLEEGASVSMVATIKEFTDYRGIKQTVVKSPKVRRLEEVEDIED
jgi:hypothetical protein